MLSYFLFYYLLFFLPKHLRLDVTQFAWIGCQCKQRANWTGQPSVIIHLHQRIKGRHWSTITCFAILSLSGCCVLLISRLRRGLQASLLVTWLTSEVHLEQIEANQNIMAYKQANLKHLTKLTVFGTLACFIPDVLSYLFNNDVFFVCYRARLSG